MSYRYDNFPSGDYDRWKTSEPDDDEIEHSQDKEEEEPMGKTLGQIAYEGYFEASGGKSLISGQLLPGWDDQAPQIKEAWEQAADRVQEAVFE